MKIRTILSRKLHIILGLLLSSLLLAVFQIIGLVEEDQNPAPTPTPSVARSVSATITPRPGMRRARVVSVVDGDTIKIEGGEIVRYIGVNTPETVAPGRPVECYGKEASAKNRELVQGKEVELEQDISVRDQFGRLLMYVWLGDEMVNESLVREGFAQVSTYPPNVKYQDRFLEAQRLAVSENAGMWGAACPTPTKTAPTLAPEQATPSAVPTY